MLKDKTTISEVGGSKRFLLPSAVLKDSTYPFKEEDNLEIEIVGDTLVIRKVVWEDDKDGA